MRKKIFIFNLILTMFFNFIPVCAEPNDILEQKESIENEPYKTLEEKKKELKEERRLMDQQRLEEIKQKEKEKKEKLGNDVLSVDVHIGQAGTANSLHILLDNSLFINGGEDFLQAVLKEDVGAVHSLDHLSGSLALTEAGDHDVLAGLHVCLLNAGLHQFLVNLYNDGSLIAVSFNALDVHLFFLPKIVRRTDILIMYKFTAYLF